MAVVFTGTTLPQAELPEIQSELYADWGTFRDMDVDIQEDFKSGAQVYESKVTVTESAFSVGPVTATGDIALAFQRSVVNLGMVQYEDLIDNSVLKSTRMEKTMKAGAFEMVSSEFDKAVLISVQPAISADRESKLWNGATAAAQTAIAALVAGAPQGSISAGAQTLVAAMPTLLTTESFPSIILHNASQSKVTPGAGIGDYVKVPSIAGAITSANIAAEYAKAFAVIDPKVIANTKNPPVWYAPLSHRSFMRIANNSVGAASNKNFEFDSSALDSKCYYNGIEVKFKPLVGFMIICPKLFLKLLMDLKNDLSDLRTGPEANGGQRYWMKNVQAMATWVTNQRYITLYGG